MPRLWHWTLEWAATASSAKAVSTGCIRNAVGSSAWQRPRREAQVGSDKLEMVAGRMLSAASGCELSTTTHNFMKTAWKKFQGADTSSVFPPPFFQDTWPCVQLLCVERNAPCQ